MALGVGENGNVPMAMPLDGRRNGYMNAVGMPLSMRGGSDMPVCVSGESPRSGSSGSLVS